MTSSADVFATARAAGRRLLSEVEAKQALAAAGIPTAVARLARSREEAVALAGELGFPAVLKVVSPEISHKSDVGGVQLDLADAEAVAAAHAAIVRSVRSAAPTATIEGVAVQRMAPPGIEVIVGVNQDPQFGPVIMFGLGGILVELLGDVVFRVLPIERRDAAQMVREIRGARLLGGYRGQPPADLAAIEKLLLDVSRFVEANSQVSELDLNPVLAYPDGVLAVDARIVLRGEDA